MIDAKRIRGDFPIFGRKVNEKKLVYLDSAATSQKPKQVVEAVLRQYETRNANVHRGVHTLAEESTLAYEEARVKVAKFINAEPEEIVFTKNATEALNLVMRSYGMKKIGSKITTTIMEHHSSFVPVQMLAKEKGAKLEVMDIGADGAIAESELDKLEGAGYASVTHVSNVLGTINPVKEMAGRIHENDGKILVDGSQSAPHMKVDVKSLDADFFVFTGHKMLAPMGIGVLYAKAEILKGMKPFLYGGDMISEVHIDESKWAEIPAKFEAGTPNVEGAIGLGTAIGYLEGLGMDEVRKHDLKLTKYALGKLAKIKGLRILGPPEAGKRAGIISFTMDGIHPHDVAQALDSEGIAVRAGHHCAQPLHERLGIIGSVRASFYIYNDLEDVDALCSGLEKARTKFL